MRCSTRLGVRSLVTLVLAVAAVPRCGGASGAGGVGGLAEDAGGQQDVAGPDALDELAPSADSSDGHATDASDASDATGSDAGEAEAAPPPCTSESVEFGPWTFDHAFAATASNVYFTRPSSAQTVLEAWPKVGGAVTDVALLDGVVSAMAANETAVYLLTRGSTTEDGVLTRLPLPAGPLQTVASAPGPLESLAIDSTHAYVARRDDAGAVLRVALSGGSFETLASGISNPWQLALNSNAVFWLSYDNASTIWTLPKAAGTPSALGSGVGRFGVDDTTLYYSQANYVRVRALSGGTPWTLAQAWPYGIFPVGAELYLKDQCAVAKVSKTGGPMQGVAAPSACLTGDGSFAVDAACVYFLHGESPASSVWTGYVDRFPR